GIRDFHVTGVQTCALPIFITPDLMFNVIEEMVRKWESQKRIHEKVLEYKQKHNEYARDEQDEIQFDLEFHKDYLTFLLEATAARSEERRVGKEYRYQMTT